MSEVDVVSKGRNTAGGQMVEVVALILMTHFLSKRS